MMRSASDRSRLALLRQELCASQCSHALVSDPIDVEYLSGFRSTNAFLLVSRTSRILLTDFRYREAARRFCRGQWRFVETREKIAASLGSALPRGARMGVQSDRLTVDQYDEIRRCAPGVRLVKLRDRLSRLSMVKLPAEIAAMARAARIGDQAFGQFTRSLAAGMTEREAAQRLEDLCREAGSEGPAFETIVLFGERAALPHGAPSDRRLRSGDWVLADFGCLTGGFRSDMTRTLVAGTASQRQREIYAIVKDAQAAGVRAVRDGAIAGAVDAAVRSRIAQAGYDGQFGHATGHGVGRRIHEAPRIARNARDILRAGFAVTIEPGIYVRNWGGVRIEDLVVVTNSGCRILTRSPRDLLEVQI